MKKYIVGLLFVVLVSFNSYAHPPGKIECSIEQQDESAKEQEIKKNLVIRIYHRVNNPKRHHLKRVVVYYNNKKLAEEYPIKEQTTKKYHELIYSNLELTPADEIQVKAYCNIGGKRIDRCKITKQMLNKK